MKKIMFSLVMLTSLALCSFTPKTTKSDATNFTVDAAKSKVDFTGSKTSDFHTGYFPVKSGSVKVDGGKLVGGSFVVNVAGLKVTDAAGEKLQGHLFSADFLDAIKFGEATFTITSVNYTRADRATVSGDLSLHGVKAPISFTAYIRSADAAKGFFAEAFFPLDRTTFGVNYGVGMIDTDVQLAIHLYASK
jgi:polyisoprenoid-binding protein YceI